MFTQDWWRVGWIKVDRVRAVLLVAAALIGWVAGANAQDDAQKALYRSALYNGDVRAQLMAAGVLDASSDTVESTKLRDAVAQFVEAYFAGETPTPESVRERLDTIHRAFIAFVDLRDSDYANGIDIKVPARLLGDVQVLSGGIETLHVSKDGAGALKYGTYRYPLRAQTPQSLLREIFYKNPNLVIETMQSDQTQFLVQGNVRDNDGRINHHFLRKAFQLGAATTALYMKFDHAAPDGFTVPDFLEPLLIHYVPPHALLEIEDDDRRHTALIAWVEKDYQAALARRHPPESVTAIRRFSTQLKEKTAEWRAEQLENHKRDIFKIAVPESQAERLAAWTEWRRDIAWRLIMRATTNISSARFDSENGWRRITVDNCYSSKRNNRDNPDYQEVRVIFATNRARGLELKAKGTSDRPFNIRKLFKNETDQDDRLHYGCLMLTVPTDQKAQQKRETHAYQDWSWRERTREVTNESVKNYYSIRRYAYLGDSGDNARGERVRLFDTERWFAPREDMALLYVHGYNTAFHESLLRIAQIAAASGYPGRVYLFSWPSARMATSYVADMDASEKSDPYLAAFIQSILMDAKIKQLDVLAHSMGGQVFLRAFSRFRSSFDQVKQVRFGTVIFAAPDVSQSVFNEKINDITPYSRKKRGGSVYASSLDRVLLLSSYLRGGKPRAGDLSRDIKFESKNVNVIDATRPAWWCDPTQYSFLGHTYFSNNEAVLQDIISRLMPSWKRREAPAQRFSKSDKCWYSSTDKSAAAVPAQQ